MEPSEKNLLACFAHPDDELGVGPLVSKLVAEGGRATLICTTDGDVGTVDPQYMQGHASIRDLRLAELACATKAIGFTEVVTFGYRDSGMMGAEDNQHPRSSWQAPIEELTEKVIEVMRRTRPQVVITFNTFGAYGHPDHIRINQATLAAFLALQGEPWGPKKLYYNTFNATLARTGVRVYKLLGRDPRRVGRNKDMDLQATVEAITPITTRVAVGAYLKQSDEARRCHASQIRVGRAAEALNAVFGRLLFGTLTLSRVYPTSRSGDPIERDVFAGL